MPWSNREFILATVAWWTAGCVAVTRNLSCDCGSNQLMALFRAGKFKCLTGACEGFVRSLATGNAYFVCLSCRSWALDRSGRSGKANDLKQSALQPDTPIGGTNWRDGEKTRRAVCRDLTHPV